MPDLLFGEWSVSSVSSSSMSVFSQICIRPLFCHASMDVTLQITVSHFVRSLSNCFKFCRVSSVWNCVFLSRLASIDM